MSRIAEKFNQLTTSNKKALIPFFTAGDPSPKLTVGVMHSMVRAGADIIELGVPFSDPMADGPVIQRASERALAQKVDLVLVFDLVRQFRKTDGITPVVLMGYANPIENMGYERFSEQCKDAGVDGVLVVDYPPEESRELNVMLREKGVDSIYLLAPTSTSNRMKEVAKMARGYVYYVSLKGVTGATHLDVQSVAERIPEIKAEIKLPIGVGFGIKDSSTAAAVSAIADAVVIGSRIVEEIESSSVDELEDNIFKLLSNIRQAIDT